MLRMKIRINVEFNLEHFSSRKTNKTYLVGIKEKVSLGLKKSQYHETNNPRNNQFTLKIKIIKIKSIERKIVSFFYQVRIKLASAQKFCATRREKKI